jgi:uncharacterized protein YeaO (DUF488 family)
VLAPATDVPVIPVQLGTRRLPNEGLRLGTVRHLPRGVRKDRYAPENWFDVWLPNLAPSAALVKTARAAVGDDKAWQRFAVRYRAEMRRPETARVLARRRIVAPDQHFGGMLLRESALLPSNDPDRAARRTRSDSSEELREGAAGYGLRATDYGLRTTGYGLRTTDYGLRTTGYGLRATSYELRATDYGLQASDRYAPRHLCTTPSCTPRTCRTLRTGRTPRTCRTSRSAIF